MRKLITLVLALVLLGAATAAMADPAATVAAADTMSCFVGSNVPNPPYTPNYCELRLRNGARYSTAKFRVDFSPPVPPPGGFRVWWSHPSCDINLSTCSLPIGRMEWKTLTATVRICDEPINCTSGYSFDVSATALYDIER
jgi:hypothetical protein